MTSDGSARITFCDLTDTVRHMAEIHLPSKTMTAVLGRVMCGASLIGSLLKNKEDSLTLRIDGDGPAGKIICVSDYLGNVRICADHYGVELPPNASGKLDVGGAVGRGTLYVIRDLGLAEPYIGSAALVSGEIAEDITAYFAQSEQIPTACALGVLVGKDQSVTAAGGYIIQLLPGAPDDIIDKIESGIQNAGAVSRLLAAGMDGQVVLETVLHGFDLEILETQPVEYRCYCSRDRVTRTLISLGRTELQSIVDDGKDIHIDCQFCDKIYDYTPDQVRQILKDLDG